MSHLIVTEAETAKKLEIHIKDVKWIAWKSYVAGCSIFLRPTDKRVDVINSPEDVCAQFAKLMPLHSIRTHTELYPDERY